MIKLDGEINGHKFKVKPKSLLARKIDKELRDEMGAWQEKNNKAFLEYSKKYEKQLLKGEAPGEVPEYKEWLEDVEFRAKRFKKMATACMEFDEPVPDSFWSSDELEDGVLEIAWDFFTGGRRIPMDISIR